MGADSSAIVRAARLALAFAIGMCAGTAAAARDHSSRNVGGWTVAASSDGTGCFLTKTFDRARETTLLLGLDIDGANHLTVLNANWSIAPRDRLELTFRLSGASFPRHFAIGIVADGRQGFVTDFGPKFVAQFAASRSLDILRGDIPVERLSLEGSGAGVAALRECVDAQRGGPPVAAGKKGASDSIPKDPFAPASERKRRNSSG